MNITMPFNWFDVLVLLLLFVGYVRGRKRGMSQECLTVLKWVVIVLVSAIAYEPLGNLLDSYARIGKLWSYVISYSFVALVIAIVFVYVNRSLGPKLTGSDTFGKGEYYLGIPAGMLRFACVLFMFLALLNARFYQTAEIKAQQKYQQDVYGSQFFPTLAILQDDVFRNSMLGPMIKDKLSFLLIKPTPADKNAAMPVVQRREFSLP